MSIDEKILEQAFYLINDKSFKDFIRKGGKKIIIFNNAFEIYKYEEESLKKYLNKLIPLPYKLIKIFNHSKIINYLNKDKSQIYVIIDYSEKNIESINSADFKIYSIDFNYFVSSARKKLKMNKNYANLVT